MVLLLLGVVAAYLNIPSVGLVVHILWFVCFSALFCCAFYYQKQLDKQITALVTGKTVVPNKLTEVINKLFGLESALNKLTRKLQSYEQDRWHQTAKQAEDSLKLMFDSSVDGLTGVSSRKYLDTRLTELVNKNTIFSVIMMDIDYFKKVNDTYGHQAGDEVLQQFAGVIVKTVRPGDLVARYGGEEFVAVCQTDGKNTLAIAERIRAMVENTVFQTCAGEIKITISLGVAERRLDENKEALIQRADKNLYHAKKTGRNKVVSEVK